MRVLLAHLLSLIIPAALSAEGKITCVVGDLVYVTGLNGAAPLWSSLRIGDLAAAEVIKELPEVLVTAL